MKEFENISEIEVLYFAMKGLCDHIVKTASQEDLVFLNKQYFEMNDRRNELLSNGMSLSRVYKRVPMTKDTILR